MGGSVETGSSSSQSNSKAVRKLTDTLAGGISGAYQPGGTSYVAPGANTMQSWADMLGAAGNTDFSSGLAGALQSFGNRAAGNEIGQNDPAYAAAREKAMGDAITATTGQFSGNGLFGSDRNQKLAAEGAGNAALGFDIDQLNNSYARQSEAANLLPQLFQNSLLPSSITGAVGAAQDADAKSQASGQTDYLAQFLSLLNGAAGPAGTKTTQSTPLWSIGLGTAASIL